MNVLFVCTGNTCRSPMAEYLFNNLTGESGHLAGSAGLAAWTGEPISDQARDVLLTDFAIDASGHRARRINAHHVENADLVLTMNNQQRDHLRHLLPDLAGKIRTIGEMAGQPEEWVDDPFGLDREAYLITARQLERLIRQILGMGDQPAPCDSPK